MGRHATEQGKFLARMLGGEQPHPFEAVDVAVHRLLRVVSAPGDLRCRQALQDPSTFTSGDQARLWRVKKRPCPMVQRWGLSVGPVPFATEIRPGPTPGPIPAQPPRCRGRHRASRRSQIGVCIPCAWTWQAGTSGWCNRRHTSRVTMPCGPCAWMWNESPSADDGNAMKSDCERRKASGFSPP